MHKKSILINNTNDDINDAMMILFMMIILMMIGWSVFGHFFRKSNDTGRPIQFQNWLLMDHTIGTFS